MEVMPVRPTLDVRAWGGTEKPEERENIVCVGGVGVGVGVGGEGGFEVPGVPPSQPGALRVWGRGGRRGIAVRQWL